MFRILLLLLVLLPILLLFYGESLRRSSLFVCRLLRVLLPLSHGESSS